MRAAQRVTRILIFIRNLDFHVYYFLFTTIYDKTKKVDNAPIVGFEIKRKCKGCDKDFVAKAFDCYYCSPPKYSQ